jgi:Flp pilus assembly protein CpaB
MVGMKNSKLNVSFLIVVVLGLLAALMTYSFLSTAKTVIYVFKDDYPAGTKITEDKLVPQQIDSSIVQQVARSNSDDGTVYITDANKNEVIGSYLITDVKKGMPLMSSYTDKLGGSPSEMRLSANNVAVTVPGDNVTGVSPYITHGSRVNVYAGFETGNNEPIEYLLLQNIKVLDVQYSEVNNSNSNSPTLSGITLEVTPEQSLSLQYAAEWGKIRLGLVKSGQYKDVSLSPYTNDKVTAVQNQASQSSVQTSISSGQ